MQVHSVSPGRPEPSTEDDCIRHTAAPEGPSVAVREGTQDVFSREVVGTECVCRLPKDLENCFEWKVCKRLSSSVDY